MILIGLFFIGYMIYAWRDHGRADWHRDDKDLREIRNVKKWRRDA